MGEHENRPEREFEIGKDEAWFANVKRTYDEFLQESLETIREQRTLFTKFVTDAQQYDNQRQVIANQSLQNAVETANMVGKQAVRHGDIAIDRQWNVNETDAFATILAAKVAEELKKKETT